MKKLLLILIFVTFFIQGCYKSKDTRYLNKYRLSKESINTHDKRQFFNKHRLSMESINIHEEIQSFIKKLNKRKRLKRKTLSLYLNKTGKYKNQIKQSIVDEQSTYRYSVIDRASFSDDIEFEKNLSENDDQQKEANIIIRARVINNELILEAKLVKDETIITISTIDITSLNNAEKKHKYKGISSEHKLDYYKAINYCQKRGYLLPTVRELEDMYTSGGGTSFWSRDQASGNNMSYGFDFIKQERFTAFRADKYYVKCITR